MSQGLELPEEEYDFFVRLAGEVPRGRRRFVTLHEDDLDEGAYQVTTHGDATSAWDAEVAARQYAESYCAVYAVGHQGGEPALWQWIPDPRSWPPGRLEPVRRRELSVSRAPRRRPSGLA